ncbi:hypothetical protein V6N12_005997 [Hibiscus sabdariffa]|uniref:DUF4283 domain-containing protein n=1 Tax=Hibiscus sabdariffa TaxID=183260 RepID=A0ABR2EWU2_9ROSI
MDCDSNLPPSVLQPAISYKDVVAGDLNHVDNEDLIPLDDDDIELTEQNVRVGITDGIPFINFSARVQEQASKSMEFTLVLKILGRKVGYSTLYNRLLSIWKPSKPIKLIDIENNYFLVKFSSRLDYVDALTDGQHQDETRMDADPTPTRVSAVTVPSEPYGPWMLVENRRRRSAKAPIVPASSVTDGPSHSSRYNPIYVENDTISEPPNIVDASVRNQVPKGITSKTPQTDLAPLLTNTSNVDHALVPAATIEVPKPVHKDTAMPRKSSPLVLAPRNSNIIVRKASSNVASGSRAPKKNGQLSNLNPEKHTALQLSPSDAPIVPSNRTVAMKSMSAATAEQNEISSPGHSAMAE